MRIVIAEDSAVVRAGLAEILADAANGSIVIGQAIDLSGPEPADRAEVEHPERAVRGRRGRRRRARRSPGRTPRQR